MTPEEIRALGTVTDVVTTGRAFGIGRDMSYRLAAEEALPVPVLRLGRRLLVRTADILRELGYEPEAVRAAPPSTAEPP